MRSVLVTGSDAASTTKAMQEICGAFAGANPRLVLAFHSAAHAVEAVSAELEKAFPESQIAGCTTMGELSPLGATQGGISAVALCEPMRVAVEWIEDVGRFRFDHGGAVVGRLAASLGVGADGLNASEHLLVTLVDGLCGVEERFMAALAGAAPGIPLVGASAGDDYAMDSTFTFANGRSGTSSAVVILLEPRVPYRPFSFHNFEASDERVVVTGASPERRQVHELNGWPATQELARLMGVDEAALREEPGVVLGVPFAFAFNVGSQLFLRSVMAVDGDGLQLAGAVSEGSVLLVARGRDLVRTTQERLAEVMAELGDVGSMLLFNCGGRALEARRTGTEAQLWEAMQPVPAAGFSGYGEHFGSMLINQSLTGVAFGGDSDGE